MRGSPRNLDTSRGRLREFEVSVITTNGLLRQVKAPQALADIVTTSSSSFEMRFYIPGYIGSFTNGLYSLVGGATPFVTYKFESGTPILKITEQRNGASYVGDIQYNSGTKVWSLQTGASPDLATLTRAIVLGTSTNRTETLEVKNAGGVLAYKAIEEYQDEVASIPYLLKSATVNPGASQLVTSYDYYTNYQASVPEWGWLRSISYPDGSWEKREYGDDPIDFFVAPLARVLRPWRDSPTSPSAATVFNSHIAEYEYQELANGTPYVNLITSSYEATYYDSRSWTRVENFPEANSGTDLRQEKHLIGQDDVGDMVLSKSYTDANPSKAGLAYSERYANGTRKSFYYETGTYDPSTRVFTVNSGTDWRMTSVTGGAPGAWGSHSLFDGKTIEPLYVIPNQSIKQTKVLRAGNILLRENYVVSAYNSGTGTATTELLDQFIYTNDSLGHTTNIVRRDPVTSATRTIYSCDWRSPSNNQDGDLKMSETDEFGVQTTYTYDGLKRVKTMTKKGVAAGGGFPAQSDIVTTYTYDAMDRVLMRIVSGGGLSLTNSYTYDLAGRLLTETSPENLTTSYANGGRTTTTTYPGGATQIIDRFLDGRIKSITGTALVNRFYDYAQTDDSVTNTFTAKNITIENVSSSGSPRQNKSLTDVREVLSQQRLPGFFTPLTNLFWFNSYGQLTATEMPTPGSTHPNSGMIRTLNEYDPSGNLMGNIARTGLDVSPTSTAQFTLASLDRIYESNVAYEKISGSLYLKTTDQKYLTDNSATPTVAAIRRERVTGLGTNVRSETTVIDADNNSTVVTVTLDLANKKATTVINTAQSTLDATSISVNGLLQSASTPTVSTPTLYFYDGLGRQVRVQNLFGFNSGTRFDTVCNQVLATTNFTGQVTSYEYYPGTHLNAGRLKAQTEADNKTSYFEHNARGQLLRKWGHVPYPEERVYNSYGELTQVKSFRAGSGWDSSTWPSGSTGTADTTTHNFQESTGLLTSQVDALSRTINYSHYTNNLLKTRFWARGTNVTYNISTLGDLTGLDFSDSTPDVTYASHDRTGRPRSITDATGAHTLTYDHAQRLTQDTGTSGTFNGITVKNRFNAVFGRDQLKLEITAQPTIQHDFGYDTYGRLSTAGSGLYVATYGYLSGSDLLQTTTSKNNGVTKLSVQRNWEFGTRLQAIANTAGSTALSWDSYTFDPVNRRARTTAVDGSAWQYDYNERGELRSARRFWTDFSPVAGQQFDFTYDNVGNRSTQSEGGDANGLNLRQTSYTPNALNQYTTVNPPNAVDIIGVATATATVTVNGTTAYRKGEYYCQPLSVTNSSAPVTLPVTVTTTQGSSITQTGMVVVAKSVTNPSYDLDGNLTDDGFWTYTWDAENRLIQVESVSSIGEAAKRKLVFTYDHAGRRATKKVYLWSGGSWSGTPSTDLKLVHDGGRLLAELNPTGNAPLRSYLWGQDHSGTFEGAGGIGGLVLQTHHGGSTTNFFPAYDGNGNVTALVNAADQSIAARYEYSAFGETLRATEPLAKANPIRFSTKCTDDETSLVCFGRRDYHPDLGRWTSRDPLGMIDGPNLYAYVGNRPTYAVDPWGLAQIGKDTGWLFVEAPWWRLWNRDPDVYAGTPELYRKVLGKKRWEDLSNAMLAGILLAAIVDATEGDQGDYTKIKPKKGSVTDANFAQISYNPNETFSKEGRDKYSALAQRPINTIDDLAGALRSGEIKADQVPVDYVVVNGQEVILNTRTSSALNRADIPRQDWWGKDVTGVQVPNQPLGVTFDTLAQQQTKKSGLPPTGTPNEP